MKTECVVFENRSQGDSMTSLKNYLEDHHPDYYLTTDLRSLLCVTLGYLEDKNFESLENLKSMINNLHLINVKATLEKETLPLVRYYKGKK